MKTKRVIAIALCTTFILSSCFANVLGAISTGDIGELKLPFLHKVGLSDEEMAERKKPINIKENGRTIYTIKRNSMVKDNILKQDMYNLNREDIKKYMEAGCTIEDIYKADEIANTVIENPKNILDRYKKDKKSLEEIKTQIKLERRQKNLDKLKSKYPQESKQIEDGQLKEDDEYAILAFINTNDVAATKDLVNDYKKNGKASLEKYFNPKQQKLSKEKMDKYGLTEKEAQGITDDEIETIAKACSKNNKSIKDVLAGRNKETAKVMGVNK